MSKLKEEVELGKVLSNRTKSGYEVVYDPVYLLSFIETKVTEAEQRGRESVLEEIRHDKEKMLDGFSHPSKDCSICLQGRDLKEQLKNQ